MKKFLALMMAAVMLLSCTALAEEAAATTQELGEGVVVDVPAGYSMEYSTSEGMTIADFIPDSDEKPSFRLMINFSEDFDGYTLTDDLTDEEYADMVAQMTMDYASPVVSLRKTGLGTPVIVINETGSASGYGVIFTIYQGWFVSLNISDAVDHSELDEEEIQTGMDIMTSLQLEKK